MTLLKYLILCCGVGESLAGGMHAHSPAVFKQFSVIHFNTLGMTFIFISDVDAEEYVTNIFTMHPS